MSFPFRLPVFADGITACEQLTGENPDEVCSEKIIADNPETLILKKKQALSNGANMLFAPTGSAVHKRLEEFGLDDDFAEINRTLTETTIKAAENKVAVGGVVVPSTLFIMPYGRDTFEDVYFTYLEKITILKDSGAEFILLQNQNTLCDMRAAVLAAKAVDIPVFVTMNVNDDGISESGNDYIAALITLQAMGADAFGIECTDGIESLNRLIKQAFSHATVPLIAVIDTEKDSEQDILSLAENGASVFIDKSNWQNHNIFQKLSQTEIRFDETAEKDCYAAAIDCEAFFLPDNLDLSRPVICGYDMSDELIDLDDENINAVYLFLNSTDDATLLSDKATMSRLPFLIHTNDSVTLEAALRYYQGRLIVDSRCDIDESILKTLAEKYGAIIY
ncbi:MAG: homocysteine S-methyltransferase family protein [Clostridia bacterium]|nr:homocysteine S-methyltransferase family protein [Clostridia bacterium]